jgi:hypothetical protein
MSVTSFQPVTTPALPDLCQWTLAGHSEPKAKRRCVQCRAVNPHWAQGAARIQICPVLL